jgi:hypothetical protein
MIQPAWGISFPEELTALPVLKRMSRYLSWWELGRAFATEESGDFIHKVEYDLALVPTLRSPTNPSSDS